MRDSINKNLSEEQILATVAEIFNAGWHSLKLYFMIGLPQEEQEDLEAIVSLCRKIVAQYRQSAAKGKLRLSVSVSPFVPKAHTPFQWDGQLPLVELGRRQGYLRQQLKGIKGVEFSSHDRQTSFLEAVFSRGDRRLGAVVVSAWQQGARFDGWTECFRPDLWAESFTDCGLDPAEYAQRVYQKDDPLPWDHLHSGVRKDWLWSERERARLGLDTLDCRLAGCNQCGVCLDYPVAVKLAGESSR